MVPCFEEQEGVGLSRVGFFFETSKRDEDRAASWFEWADLGKLLLVVLVSGPLPRDPLGLPLPFWIFLTVNLGDYTGSRASVRPSK
ncbi:hypothetical protein MPNT_20108 [Candidatus Methylacidithermus pantelleriae]|uniref:Uncharacterized protein n=1 Tax=Candidatus Methylacidithermus pantelleriae TaxID=2744239 RepID=A0A8J2FP20_9BACT|nr:hypothetical protein MPNT_20108 [Candidatus Methylacidithermus pantelleriae]